MKHLNILIAIAGGVAFAFTAAGQSEVNVVASSSGTIRPDGPTTSPWFHNAQVAGSDFSSYAISSFTVDASEFGAGEIASIDSISISYTQANAGFTTNGPLELYISFDATVSGGDYSGLRHNATASGIDNRHFSDSPRDQMVGTGTFTEVESGTVDAYTLDVSEVESDLIAAIQTGTPFSIILSATGTEGAATYSGAESTTYLESIFLTISATVDSAVDTGLIITGVMDGPLPGGLPKVIELYALEDIADLSVYGVGSANNGGGTDGEELTLEGSASAGDYIWIASEDVEFANVFGGAPNFVSDAANINGDDAIELFKSGVVVDVFGEIDVDGTGQPWEHLDGWAYRVNDTVADGMFTIANWTFSGINALDDLDAAGTLAAVPFGTYTNAGVDTANILPNYDFTAGEDGKEGWTTFLNVSGADGGYKYGTAFDTESVEIVTGSVTLSAHPGWSDNGNGPADLGDVIENNFYADFGGTPAFAGQEVTFSGSLKLGEEFPEGATALAFIKILDGSWGLAQFISADISEVDGTFELTATVPTENMNAFQVGFLTLAPAGSEGAIYFYNLELVGDSGENLIPNPDFTMGEGGKEGWANFLNVFGPTGENYKYGTGFDGATAVVNDKFADMSVHPGWSDNGNGPLDLGDTIENNFYYDFGGTPAFAGEEVTFSGSFDVGVPLAEGVLAGAFIKILDGSWGLAQLIEADVEESDGTFSLTAVVPTENMNAFQVGFATIGTAGTQGSLTFSNLRLEVTSEVVEPDPLPWEGVAAGEMVVSPWFGAFEGGTGDWIEHDELGWLWMGYVETTDSLWMYSYYWNSWLWSAEGTFPVVYDTTSGKWLYYFRLMDIGAFVYDYSTSLWTFIP